METFGCNCMTERTLYKPIEIEYICIHVDVCAYTLAYIYPAK